MIAATLILAQSQTAKLDPTNPNHIKLASEYSANNKGVSMLVMVNGKIIHEDYPAPRIARTGLELASGTKSFAGVAAAFLVAEGKLTLKDPVSKYIPEWQTDPQKKDVTIDQLLHLTGGVDPGKGGNPQPYADSIALPLNNTPGEKFQYGPTSFQIWGQLVKNITGKNQVDYLQEKLFTPLGIAPQGWRKDANGDPHIPSGARFTARDWATFGEFIRNKGVHNGQRLIEERYLAALTQTTEANTGYGLTWWVATERNINSLRANPMTVLLPDFSNPGVPRDLFMAAGAGNQRLYISPSLKLVAVRQAGGIRQSMEGDRTGYRDNVFLSLLTTGKP